ncbi:DNA primase subunit pri2 [Hamiltosporidium tvaerminnensis]|nr:DNA primase subunit pri2 [Hamiltosporidium tvaerminnensis]
MKRIKNIETPFILNFYTSLNVKTLNFNDFNDFVTKRLKTLRRIESSLTDLRLLDIKDAMEDNLSHFLCRLVCSQVMWSLIWFVNHETKLFELKIQSLNDNQITDFFFNKFILYLKNLQINGEILQINKNSELSDQKITEIRVPRNGKIYFSKIHDLIANRRVDIIKGYTDLNIDTIKSFMVNEFRNFLENKMNSLYLQMLREPDERFFHIFKLHFVQPNPVISEFSSLKENETFFPPCMFGIMKRLTSTKHLKYNDRQSLILFLKGIGMPVEKTIEFLRNSFNLDNEVFNKEYLYSIRHNYGLEGKRANYPPYTCSKMGSLCNNNSVGCPFLGDKTYVKDFLNIKNINLDLEDLIKSHPGQKACSKILNVLIEQEAEPLITSPVNFYNLFKNKNNKNVE